MSTMVLSSAVQYWTATSEFADESENDLRLVSCNSPCRLVLQVTEQPDVLTGMWIVAPEEDRWGQCIHAVVLLDTILRPAHLIPVYGADPVPTNFHFTDS